MDFEVKNIEEFQTGKVIPIYKPYEWTSFDVVKKLKNQIWNKLCDLVDIKKKNFKVGHAGTLDPLAEGLLIICTGKATKKISGLMSDEKEYVATIELGKTTPSYDLETEYDEIFPIDHINEEKVENAIKKFIGEQDQVPPIYSAKSINGKKAYDYARNNEEIVLKANKIIITEIELLEYSLPKIVLRIVCGKGTYIRSLAYDLGKELNSGGHLVKLIRSRIGDYNLDSSMTIEEFGNILSAL